MTTRRARQETGPTVAVVGRPNVGKSTLVNRLIGRRDAIVEEKPGVTRDRTRHQAEWSGKKFALIDTGGWIPGWARQDERIDGAVADQAEAGTREADIVLLVVDATVGISEQDAAVARWVRATGKPVVLVANKVDQDMPAAQIAELYGLGVGEPVPVSALHGRGSGDLLDVILANLRSVEAFDRADEPDDELPGVALIGRPNVGKSSLFNKIIGEDRTIVDDRPGTTRDAVDTVIELDDGRAYRLVDTAGLRRKTRKNDATEYYSTVRTVQALDAADIALLMVDAGEGFGEQEQKLARQVLDAGRALIIVLNKWDLVDEYQREVLERERDRLLHFVDFAPLVRISALTGRSLDKLWPRIDAVLEEWTKRIPTAPLNTWLADAVAATPPPLSGGRTVRLRYATQVAVGPPTFRVFSTAPVSAGYVRYLERRLRETFGFSGTPLDVKVRVRPRWEERPGITLQGHKKRKRPVR